VLTVAHMLCFGLIWIAVGFFVFDAWRAGARTAEAGR